MNYVDDWSPLEHWSAATDFVFRVPPGTNLSSLPLDRFTHLRSLTILTQALRLTWEDLDRLPPSVEEVRFIAGVVLSSPSAVELAARRRPRISLDVWSGTLSHHPELFRRGVQAGGNQVWTRVTPEIDFQPLDLSQLTSLQIEGSVLSTDQWAALWRVDGLRFLTVKSTPLRDRDLVGIENLRYLTTLELKNVLITDEGLRRIAQLPKLERLVLESSGFEASGPDITAQGLAALGRCTSLEHVQIHVPTRIGDAFAQWRGVKDLSLLSLRGTEIDAGCLQDLAQLSNLGSLELRGTNFDDALLPALAQFPPSLKVYIRGTRATRDAVQRFRRDHPDVQVTY
jgi:hypothetical protein